MGEMVALARLGFYMLFVFYWSLTMVALAHHLPMLLFSFFVLFFSFFVNNKQIIYIKECKMYFIFFG